MNDAILSVGYQRYAMNAEDAIKVIRLLRNARPVDSYYDKECGQVWVYDDAKIRLNCEFIDSEILDKKPEPKLEDTLGEQDDKAA